MCVFVAELLETAQFAMMWSFVIWVVHVLRTYIAECIARHNLIYGGWGWISRRFLELFVVLITRIPASPVDAVFGNHLHRVCDRDGCNVPHFVTRTIAAIEMRGEACWSCVHVQCRSTLRQAHNSRNSSENSEIMTEWRLWSWLFSAVAYACTVRLFAGTSYTEHMLCFETADSL